MATERRLIIKLIANVLGFDIVPEKEWKLSQDRYLTWDDGRYVLIFDLADKSKSVDNVVQDPMAEQVFKVPKNWEIC